MGYRIIENLQQHIEAIVFASETAVKVAEINAYLAHSVPDLEISDEEIDRLLEDASRKYSSDAFAFQLKKVGGGWQFLSKDAYHQTIATFLNVKERKRLSSAALETLSIIAYKQPITKTEIEQIRGVNCDYTIHRLLDKDLIEIAGKKDAPGKPILYEVSQSFLDHFGINSTGDLPQMKEIVPQEENTVGEAPD